VKKKGQNSVRPRNDGSSLVKKEGVATRATETESPKSPLAVLGYARKFGRHSRTTKAWMREIRAGDTR